MIFTAIDLEMTGLSSKTDKILEIGAVRFEDGVITGTYSQLVNPGVTIPEHITEITGITQEMVQDMPDIRAVLPKVLDFCGDSVLVGHNLIYDFAFLKKAAVNQKFSFERQGIDTLKLARMLSPEMTSRKLDQVCEHLGIVMEHHHRALADAEAAGKIFLYYKEHFPEHEGLQPKPLQFQVKKEQPASKRQWQRLAALYQQFGLEPDCDITTLTKNEISRRCDQLRTQYGNR